MSKIMAPPIEKLVDSNIKVGAKEGTIIEKGVILSEGYLNENMGDIGGIMSVFTAYPDVYLDLIKP